jgi:hypothetical protein
MVSKITKTTTTSAFQPTGANPKFHIARRVRARSVFPGTTRILSRRDFWSVFAIKRSLLGKEARHQTRMALNNPCREPDDRWYALTPVRKRTSLSEISILSSSFLIYLFYTVIG